MLVLLALVLLLAGEPRDQRELVARLLPLLVPPLLEVFEVGVARDDQPRLLLRRAVTRELLLEPGALCLGEPCVCMWDAWEGRRGRGRGGVGDRGSGRASERVRRGRERARRRWTGGKIPEACARLRRFSSCRLSQRRSSASRCLTAFCCSSSAFCTCCCAIDRRSPSLIRSRSSGTRSAAGLTSGEPTRGLRATSAIWSAEPRARGDLLAGGARAAACTVDGPLVCVVRLAEPPVAAVSSIFFWRLDGRSCSRRGRFEPGAPPLSQFRVCPAPHVVTETIHFQVFTAFQFHSRTRFNATRSNNHTTLPHTYTCTVVRLRRARARPPRAAGHPSQSHKVRVQ